MDSHANQYSNASSKYFIISSDTRNDLKSTSPSLIHKSIISIAGEVKSNKKLNNGNILIEVLNSKQAENLMKLENIGTIKVTVSPHHTLNHSKGVISESEFQRDLEEDLLECLQTQNLTQAKESKEEKRARILAAKRDQSSLGDGSLSREDFLKDSFKTNKIGDDDDSDSLLKVHPSEDDMSTSEVDEPPLSS
ncbi:hypothetical protein AVEN_24558-1 [Araneus ventricosus]|uniref:Uncharacterized protein n=1 Tax=Araneus ventricosus TaxID=182803 RepID=A0A4Y2TDE8_ARAVE|nr:hypothetical protein AVEN_24558-1 [Araneus ventricosus]